MKITVREFREIIQEVLAEAGVQKDPVSVRLSQLAHDLHDIAGMMRRGPKDKVQMHLMADIENRLQDLLKARRSPPRRNSAAKRG